MFPPYPAVAGPGLGIEPRVPQQRTRTEDAVVPALSGVAVGVLSGGECKWDDSRCRGKDGTDPEKKYFPSFRPAATLFWPEPGSPARGRGQGPARKGLAGDAEKILAEAEESR